MSIVRFFTTHRTWEEWCGMVLGILIVLSPWFSTHPDHTAVVANALIVGILVFGLSQLEYLSLQRWEEAGAFVLGIWLIVSPFVFDYAGAAHAAHLALRARRSRDRAGGSAALAGLAAERSGAGATRQIGAALSLRCNENR